MIYFAVNGDRVLPLPDAPVYLFWWAPYAAAVT